MKKTLMCLALASLSQSAYAGKTTRAIEPIMETIPSGQLLMESRDGVQHKIEMPQFSMGKYEVTVAEFRQFIEATNYQAPTECRHEMDTWFLMFSPGNWETNALNTSEYQPVVCINWQAASDYADWLAKETGKPYRLPSEAEWEYAARAGTTTDYYFGNDEDNTKVCEYENTGDLFGENLLQMRHNTSYQNWTGDIAQCNDYSGYASIVGMYKPNPFGLHDMVSNVLEFLADCHTSDITQLPKDGSALVSEDCERRARRGASWHWSHWPLTNRGSQSTDFAGGVDGFRLALDGAKPKLSKNSKRFLKKLKFAQTKEQKMRDHSRPIPNTVTDLAIVERNGTIKLSWKGSSAEGRESYRVYKNDLPGKMFRLYATNLYDTEFVDANPQNHEYEYTVVAVRHHQQSAYATPVKKSGNHNTVPGVIEAEWLKQIDGAAISYTSDETTGARLGFNLSGREGIAKDAKVEYQIDVEESGQYLLNYRVATPRNTKGFRVLLNGQQIATSDVLETGGYHEWQTQGDIKVQLPKGQHTLTLVSLDNNWKLNWFELNRI